jgi:tetratricopeptide (TPR) repeat protein
MIRQTDPSRTLGKFLPFLCGAALLAAAGCAVTGRGGPGSPQGPAPGEMERLKEASALLAKGHQSALLEAHQIFGELTSTPSLLEEAGEGYLKSGILLHLRRKEMGVLTASDTPLLHAFLARYPQFQRFQFILDLLHRIPPSTRGILGKTGADDSQMDDYLDWLRESFPGLREKLGNLAETEEFYAYLYVAFVEAFSFRFETPPDLSDLRERFPDSILLAYKLATYPRIKEEELNAILGREPDLVEAHFFLGDLALSEGRVLTAEKHFREALAAFPESTSSMISLARIYLYLEEVEDSLRYDEEALKLEPSYRDALLGKAMCLCYMGKFQQSIQVLEEMLRLGLYMIGEAHYWLARNLNELDRLDEARTHIEKARSYIIGQYEIPALDGQIAYKQGRLDEAETCLNEALSLYNDDCESAYTLGQVYTDMGRWMESAVFFARGSGCNGIKEKALERKILEIEKADLDPERKARMIHTKKTQILHHRRTRAGCDFNAAAGYYNAGNPELALDMARRAALYPLFKDRAQELIRRIEKEKSR